DDPRGGDRGAEGETSECPARISTQSQMIDLGRAKSGKVSWGGPRGGSSVSRPRREVGDVVARGLDLAAELAAGADHQAAADDEFALEAAAHLGLVDRRGTLEQARFGDLDLVAVLQIRLDAALDDELVAGRDLA